MSQKNLVSNFISADDEILAFLSNFSNKWCVSNDGAKFIEQNFTFIGSKPVLQNLKDYKTAEYKNFADIKKFLSSNLSIKSKILSGDINYIGDNLTNIEIKFTPEDFYDFLKFIVENIPEHHYFCSPKEGWILFIAMEGYVEFGVLH
ncbi:hypothetical protein [Campylobacter concisus]|uniref:hypothetical protein n=1 Tax=Campylobacter concisus TaxID=199 RepID=UPI000CD8BBC4|nr:hypothetical protein [Campylobacter concisus]QPH87842.1 hypothetical protein CVT15_03595 [Campylobacter concisus]QPI02786.1 hypothetical protein G5B95_03550 [Campylobacter concisus]